MNKQSKRTFGEGIVFLALVAASLVVYLNWSYASVKSNRAQITLSNYAVGTEYAGVITKQFVTAGTIVKAGDKLFMLKSDELTQQLKSGQTTAASLVYPLSEDGEMIIVATKAGTVSHIDAQQGSFVAAGKQIATVADTSTLGLTADFSLNKSELGRLTPGTPFVVTLPSRQKVSARIYSVVQSSQAGKPIVTIQGTMTPDSVGTLTSAGTQVDAALILDQSTYYVKLLGYTQSLLARWF